MFRARASLSRVSKRLKPFQTSPFCSKSRIGTNKNSNNGEINGRNKVESDLSSYKEAYKQLDNLDFMTASKILFTDPPKKKKFGIDFHLVQLFFVCMPSLAVYLVAQYARYEMRKMEADLELKKKKEEEAVKQIKLEEREEIHDKNQELQEVKTRLDKLEETIKEIAVESRKQSGSGIVTKNSEKAQGVDKTKHGANIDPSKSMDDHLGGQKIVPAPVLPKSRASTTGEDSKHQNQGGASSPDSKR